jgi:hypothetical protein
MTDDLDTGNLGSLVRFAVLRHSDVDEPHYDFLVETSRGSDLATWRSPTWPLEDAVVLTRLKDHRKIYLEFEGELTAGRGRVDRVDGGDCQLSIEENAVWKITILNPKQPMWFTLRHLDGDEWMAEV